MSDTTTNAATVAFVGCAHIHTPGFVNNVNKREDVSCKYVYDQNRVRAEKRAADLKGEVQVADDVQRILDDPEVKAIIVCTETTRHEDVVLPAAEAKKHLFVEKPLGYSASDAYRMADAIDKAGVQFQTGYFMRGDAKNVFLKRQIEAGAFGKITRVRGSNCHGGALGGWFDSKPDDPASDWRWMADPKVAGVGGFGDLGTHSLDILLWLMGDVTTVTAQIDPGTGRYEGCDETGEGLLRFESGAIGTLAAGWDDVANPVSLLISGTEGHAAIVNGQLFFQSKHVEGADGKTPYESLPSAVPAGMDAFLNAVVGQRDSILVTAREAAYRSAVMEALYTGAKEGRWVAPSAG
jgi:predicted dehydrogenase